MTRRIVLPGVKDENGAYVKQPVEGPTTEPPPATPLAHSDMSIDELLKCGLNSIAALMRVIALDISTGEPKRETVQNLKDAMSMLEALKEREEDVLEEMDEDQLQATIGESK